MANQEPQPSPTQQTPVAPVPPAPQVSQVVGAEANDAIAKASSAIDLDKIDSSASVYMLGKLWILIPSIIAGVFLARYSFWCLSLPVVVWLYLQHSYENNLFKAFAATNHYSYEKTPDVPIPDGIYFNTGREKKITDMVTGTYQNWPFKLFLYAFKTGVNKYNQPNEQAIMSVDFKTILPAFVLIRPQGLDLLAWEDNMVKNQGYPQKVNLEGDFEKNFEVFIRANTQDDALSILTPDVMQILLGLKGYELELTESGTLYIYVGDLISKKQDLINIYTVLQSIVPKINRHVELQKRLTSTLTK